MEVYSMPGLILLVCGNTGGKLVYVQYQRYFCKPSGHADVPEITILNSSDIVLSCRAVDITTAKRSRTAVHTRTPSHRPHVSWRETEYLPPPKDGHAIEKTHFALHDAFADRTPSEASRRSIVDFTLRSITSSSWRRWRSIWPAQPRCKMPLRLHSM